MFSIKEIVDHNSSDKFILILKYESPDNIFPLGLTITKLSVTYTGTITVKLMHELQSKTDVADIQQLTFQALTENSANSTFFYEIKDISTKDKEDGKIIFSWKNSFIDGTKYVLGSISLQTEDNNDVILSTLKLIGDQIKGLQAKNDELLSKQKGLSNECEKLLHTIEESVVHKDQLERDIVKSN